MHTTSLPPDNVLAAAADPLFDLDRHTHDDLHHELRALGLSAGELEEIEEVIARHVRAESFRMAAEAFAEVVRQLAETHRGAELAAALGLAPASFSEIGARWQVSKQSCQQASARLANALGRFTISKAGKRPRFEPPSPEHERRLDAARRWPGLTKAIKSGALTVTMHAGRAWVVRAEVDRLRDAAELAAAESRLRRAPALQVDDLNKVQ